jgi:hypothetical protein
MAIAAASTGSRNDEPNFMVLVVQRTIHCCKCQFLDLIPSYGSVVLDGTVGFECLVLLWGGI